MKRLFREEARVAWNAGSRIGVPVIDPRGKKAGTGPVAAVAGCDGGGGGRNGDLAEERGGRVILLDAKNEGDGNGSGGQAEGEG